METHRATFGTPHWILVDEAHEYLREGAAASRFLLPDRRGYLVVSYHPALLSGEVAADLDATILLPGAGFEPPPATIPGCEEARALVRRATRGQAVLVEPGATPCARLVTLGSRRTAHVRHRHKYVSGLLPERLRFEFRAAGGGLTGARAANVAELHRELSACGLDVILHHSRGGDLSRWVEDMLGDRPLARRLSLMEALARGDPSPEALERVRRGFLAAIEDRYIA